MIYSNIQSLHGISCGQNRQSEDSALHYSDDCDRMGRTLEWSGLPSVLPLPFCHGWTLLFSIHTCKIGISPTSKAPENQMTSLVAQTVKHLPTMWETCVRSLVGKISWRRKRQPSPVLLPGKFHGQRSLVGYGPCGRKESDTTERLHFYGQCSPNLCCTAK